MLPFIAIPMELLPSRRKTWIRLFSIQTVLFRELMHCLQNISICSAIITIPTLNLYLHSTKEVYLKANIVVGLIGQYPVTRFQDQNSRVQGGRMLPPLHLTLLRPGL